MGVDFPEWATDLCTIEASTVNVAEVSARDRADGEGGDTRKFG